MRIARWWWIIGAAAAAVVAVSVLLVVLPQAIRSLRTGCFDRTAFDQVVAKLPPPPTDRDAFDWVDAPDKIGSCRILSAYGVNGGYIFYDKEMRGFDDFGWGYFPAGPNDDLGNGSWEGPRFEQIEGPWYTWTASW
jgi:hypothetical protein